MLTRDPNISMARDGGFEVSGTDYSPHAVAAANRVLGAKAVRRGSLETLRFRKASFDVCVLFDVLEHTRRPLAHGLAPRGLARRPVKLVASGMHAMGRVPS